MMNSEASANVAAIDFSIRSHRWNSCCSVRSLALHRFWITSGMGCSPSLSKTLQVASETILATISSVIER